MALAPYADLDGLKARIGETTSARDGDLAGFIFAASEAIELFTGRDFGPGTRTEYGYSDASFIMPKAGPIAGVTSLTVEGEVVAAKVIMGRIAIERTDRQDISGEWVLVYTTTDPVPPTVALATLMTAQAMSDAPAFDTNLTGVSVGGVVQGGFQQTGAGNIPLGAQSLLRPLVRVFQP